MVPALYDPNGRYRYIAGCNWRAAVAFLLPVAPLLPGLAFSITGAPGVQISQGAQNLYTFDWLFGFVTSIVLYTGLSKLFPDKNSLVEDTIWHLDAVEGVPSDVENGAGSVAGSGGEIKGFHESDAKVY